MIYNLGENKIIPYFSTGSIQLYHIVEDLLQQTGKADLFLSSFTISEEFIRKLQKLKEEKLVENLQLLIDLRSAKKTIHLSWFLANVANEVFLNKNHSKLVIIKNDRFKISMVTSANMTRGNRHECGMISTVHDHYDYFYQQIKIVLKDSLKLNEVLRKTDGTN